MRANSFDRLSLGNFYQGQGTQNAVERTHRFALRALAARLASKLTRGISVRLGHWHALLLKRLPAETMPALAMCPITADRRRQRDQRWMSGVVATPGTVGVC
jgi:hypothetical protein